MLSIFLRTLPFFLTIGAGYGTGCSGLFLEVATRRVSSSILISPTAAIFAVSLVIGLVNQHY